MNALHRRLFTTCSLRRYPIKQFKLADIGEGITECEIVSWTAKPADKVSLFDPLCEVQSDKASVELTSPYDGTIQELFYKEGDIAKVGDVLCSIDVQEDVQEQSTLVSPNVPGSTSSTVTSSDTDTAPVQNEARNLHPLDPKYEKPRQVLATPSARHFARSANIDIADLHPGSGKNGRIEKSDIQAFLDQTPLSNTTKVEDSVIVELGRTRYGMWKAMTKSLDIPVFGYSTTLDLTPLHAMMPTLNKHIPSAYLGTSAATSPLINPSAIYPAPQQAKLNSNFHYHRLTYLPLLLKTLSKAMHEWPLFRSIITPQCDKESKPTLTIRPTADITTALSTPTGLYTPTLKAVSADSVYGIAGRLADLSTRARQTPCALTAEELKGTGTISVSNVGAVGKGDFAAPVLVPSGGIAIVAIGRAQWVWDVSPEINDGLGERRLKVGVSWSADHRVVEGAEMAAFCETWREYVEHPAKLIGNSI